MVTPWVSKFPPQLTETHPQVPMEISSHLSLKRFFANLEISSPPPPIKTSKLSKLRHIPTPQFFSISPNGDILGVNISSVNLDTLPKRCQDSDWCHNLSLVFLIRFQDFFTSDADMYISTLSTYFYCICKLFLVLTQVYQDRLMIS